MTSGGEEGRKGLGVRLGIGRGVAGGGGCGGDESELDYNILYWRGTYANNDDSSYQGIY